MIGEISAVARSIAAAVEQQPAATGEIARNVAGTAAAVNAMGDRNAEVLEEAGRAGSSAATLLENTKALDAAVVDLKHSVVRTVRTSTAEVDRRVFQRVPVELTCDVEAGGTRRRVRMVELSEGGARLTRAHQLRAGTNGMLRLDGVATPLPFVVVDAANGELRVTFRLGAAALLPVLERSAVPRAA